MDHHRVERQPKGCRQQTRAKRARNGSILPYVILTSLFAFAGLVLLASRSNESNLNSIFQSDHATAKEAAEYGFSQLVSQLNTPENGYLWVTNWDKNSKSWVSVSKETLDKCRISISSSGTAGSYSALIGKKTLPSNTTANYQLITFAPPQVSEGTNPPTDCTSFGNLFGGSATLIVKGLVERSSGATAAEYILERRVHVIGPKVGGLGEFPLIILGGGSSVGKADDDFVQAESPSTNVNKANSLSIACVKPANQCFGSGGAPSTTEVRNTTSFTFPTFPTPTSLGVPSGELNESRRAVISITSAADKTKYSRFPFKSDATPLSSAAASRSEINGKLITDDNGNSICTTTSGADQIVCLISSITVNPSGSSYSFQVDTTGLGVKNLPVNLFFEKLSTDTASAVLKVGGNHFIGARPVTLDEGTPGYDPAKWNTLRLYGKNLGDNSEDCGSQKIDIGGSAAIKGAFSWFPNATIEYGVGGGGGALANNFGIMWICKFLGPSSENQGYGARLDSPTGLGQIFGEEFSGISDIASTTGVPITFNYYRGYGVSSTDRKL